MQLYFQSIKGRLRPWQEIEKEEKATSENELEKSINSV